MESEVENWEAYAESMETEWLYVDKYKDDSRSRQPETNVIPTPLPCPNMQHNLYCGTFVSPHPLAMNLSFHPMTTVLSHAYLKRGSRPRPRETELIDAKPLTGSQR